MQINRQKKNTICCYKIRPTKAIYENTQNRDTKQQKQMFCETEQSSISGERLPPCGHFVIPRNIQLKAGKYVKM